MAAASVDVAARNWEIAMRYASSVIAIAALLCLSTAAGAQEAKK
jgi:hypothetical protein